MKKKYQDPTFQPNWRQRWLILLVFFFTALFIALVVTLLLHFHSFLWLLALAVFTALGGGWLIYVLGDQLLHMCFNR